MPKYLVTTRQNEKRKRTNSIIYFMVKAPCYKDLPEGINKKWDLENLTSFLIRYNISYMIYILKWRNYKLCAALLVSFAKKAKQVFFSLDKRAHFALYFNWYYLKHDELVYCTTKQCALVVHRLYCSNKSYDVRFPITDVLLRWI